jgi:hypothetical protein
MGIKRRGERHVGFCSFIVIRRIEAVGNNMLRYIEKVATDVIRRAWNLR